MYFLLENQDAEFPCRWMDDEPYIEGVNFRLGVKIQQELPLPLHYTLEPEDPHANDHGPEMPAIFLGSTPLFSDTFIQALVAAGVKNFDAYPAVIADPDNGKTYSHYKTINILDMISAADLEQSTATVYHNKPTGDVDFDKLIVDETKANKTGLFRLAESNTSILIHSDVKDALIAAGFDHVSFSPLETSAL